MQFYNKNNVEDKKKTLFLQLFEVWNVIFFYHHLKSLFFLRRIDYDDDRAKTLFNTSNTETEYGHHEVNGL